jgi:hypothetical protein
MSINLNVIINKPERRLEPVTGVLCGGLEFA